MEDKSYIKLFRKILKSPIWENEKALKIWIWCLLKATHIERVQLVGQQKVYLKKGQFVFGRKKASEEININESTIYKYIKLLEELEMITIDTNTRFSIITINKWEMYQVEELNCNSKSNNKITGLNFRESKETEEIQTDKMTTKEQQSNTNKNVKNIYLYLLNKYREQIEKEHANRKIQIISACQSCKEYEMLTEEEQEQLFYDLMDVEKRFK